MSRPPTTDEKAVFGAALKTGDPRDNVFRDLLWALLNAKDFAFNH